MAPVHVHYRSMHVADVTVFENIGYVIGTNGHTLRKLKLQCGVGILQRDDEYLGPKRFRVFSRNPMCLTFAVGMIQMFATGRPELILAAKKLMSDAAQTTPVLLKDALKQDEAPNLPREDSVWHTSPSSSRAGSSGSSSPPLSSGICDFGLGNLGFVGDLNDFSGNGFSGNGLGNGIFLAQQHAQQHDLSFLFDGLAM